MAWQACSGSAGYSGDWPVVAGMVRSGCQGADWLGGVEFGQVRQARCGRTGMASPVLSKACPGAVRQAGIGWQGSARRTTASLGEAGRERLGGLTLASRAWAGMELARQGMARLPTSRLGRLGLEGRARYGSYGGVRLGR
jgi:hypothetical protein